MITAAGKMRNGTRMGVSYSGDISETISFEKDPEVNRRNHQRFDAFIRSRSPVQPNKLGNYVWQEVSGGLIADLLEETTVHQGSRKARGDYLAKYIRDQNARGALGRWTVALISNLSNSPGDTVELGGCRFVPFIGRSTTPAPRMKMPSIASAVCSTQQMR